MEERTEENIENNNIEEPEGERKWTVYIHTVPKELSGYEYDKYYVGITSQKPERRWGYNGSRYDDRHPYFKNAIQKYGWNNIKHDIIKENLTKDEACIIEKNLIHELKSNNKNYGYNITSGGEGVCGIIPWNKNGHLSEETKQKLSDKLKGRYIDDDWKKNIGNAVKKRWEDGGDLRERMSGANNPNYGKPGFFKDKKGFDNLHSKPIICLNTMKIYGSSSFAAEDTGINFSSICACCRGDNHTIGIDSYGVPMVWMWYNDYKKLSEQEINNYIYDKLSKTRYKPVINMDSMELFSRNKFALAQYSTAKNDSYFIKCIKSDKIVYGHKWRYYVDYLKENNLNILEAQKSLFFIA